MLSIGFHDFKGGLDLGMSTLLVYASIDVAAMAPVVGVGVFVIVPTVFLFLRCCRKVCHVQLGCT